MIPLRWKLLIALPAINVITGRGRRRPVHARHARLSDLGLDVLAAVAVAFTVSLELTLLLARSILEPIEDLRAATHRVAQGDLATRVPGHLHRRDRRAGRLLQRDGGGPRRSASSCARRSARSSIPRWPSGC